MVVRRAVVAPLRGPRCPGVRGPAQDGAPHVCRDAHPHGLDRLPITAPTAPTRLPHSRQFAHGVLLGTVTDGTYTASVLGRRAPAGRAGYPLRLCPPRLYEVLLRSSRWL